MTETQKNKMMSLAMALGVVYVVWKFVPMQAAKAAALGVGGVIVARQVPYVKEALSA